MPRLRARIHAQRPKRAHARCTVLLRSCQIARTWRTQTAPARGANDGRCAAATVYGTVLRGATSRDRPVPTRQRQRERPCSGSFSLKAHRISFPGSAGPPHHGPCSCTNRTKDMILKSDRSLRAHVATTHRPCGIAGVRRGARHFKVAHAIRATLRRSLFAASARTGRARA